MKEERMHILNMVQEGKVKPEEAIQLLDAVARTGAAETTSKSVNRAAAATDWQANFEEGLKSFTQSLDEMGKEIGKRLDEVGRDVEPKVRKVAQTIVSKTSECVDEISNTLKKDAGSAADGGESTCGCEGDSCCEESQGNGEPPKAEEACDCGCEAADDEPKEN